MVAMSGLGTLQSEFPDDSFGLWHSFRAQSHQLQSSFLGLGYSVREELSSVLKVRVGDSSDQR